MTVFNSQINWYYNIVYLILSRFCLHQSCFHYINWLCNASSNCTLKQNEYNWSTNTHRQPKTEMLILLYHSQSLISGNFNWSLPVTNTTQTIYFFSNPHRYETRCKMCDDIVLEKPANRKLIASWQVYIRGK